MKIMVLAIIMLFASTAFPLTYYVAADPNIYPPSVIDFYSVQEAVNYVGSGDTIRVMPGTYDESVYIKGKAIQILSSGPDDPDITSKTYIAGPVLVEGSLGDAPGMELAGLTIQSLQFLYCGTAQLEPVVRNCFILGELYLSHSYVFLIHNIVVGEIIWDYSPVDADFNRDGVVDMKDFAVLVKGGSTRSDRLILYTGWVWQ